MIYPEAFDRMLAAWNEPDPAKVRGHLDAALATEIEFIDPSIETRGIDEFEANVHQVHADLPGRPMRVPAALTATTGCTATAGRSPVTVNWCFPDSMSSRSMATARSAGHRVLRSTTRTRLINPVPSPTG
ncbi:MAG: hypothetical protein R2789_02735 [Microthrixaceae bacterium]